MQVVLVDTNTETLTVTVEAPSGVVTLHRYDLTDEIGYDRALDVVLNADRFDRYADVPTLEHALALGCVRVTAPDTYL